MRGGYTLIRMLVVVTVIALSLGMSLPAFQAWIQRVRVEGHGQALAALMHLARKQAVLDGGQVVVAVDSTTGEVYAFRDRNGATPGSAGDGLFNPVEGAPVGSTDQKIGSCFPRGGVEYTAPRTEELIDGFTAVAGGRAAIFTDQGAVRDPGALRFGDRWGNYLEVRVAPAATARVVVRKYRDGGGGDGGWFSRAENGGPWEWYWGKGRRGT